MSDPLRVAILSRLARDPASAAQLAAGLEERLERVRYQLRRMREVGLVDAVGTSQAVGRKENLYSVDPARFVLEDEELEGFSPEDLDRALASLVRIMFRESAAVVRSEPSTEREDAVVRIPMAVDQKGWLEASALLRKVLSDVITVGNESRERLGESAEQPIRTLVTVLLFALADNVEELPPIEPGTRDGE